MNSRVTTISVKRKSDLKKFMQKIEEVGSAIIVNPTQAKKAELVVEKYYFNQAMSSTYYPDSVPILSIQRKNETVLITTLGKVSKTVIQNLAHSYYSAKTTKNFFIPVDVSFDKFYNEKNVYLVNKDEVTDISEIEGSKIKDGLISDNAINLVSSEGTIFVSDFSELKWKKIELGSINTIALSNDNTLYAGTGNGVYLIDCNEDSCSSKLEGVKGSNVFDIGFVDNYMIVTEDKKEIKTYIKTNGDWELSSEYKDDKDRMLSIKGYSEIFGGALMITASSAGLIDKIRFLSIPKLKILQHSRYVQT